MSKRAEKRYIEIMESVNTKPNPLFDAWFAGFFDGEGIIHRFTNGTRGIRVTQTIQDNRYTEQLFIQIVKEYGGKYTRKSPSGIRTDGTKYYDYYEWIITRMELVVNVIERLLPYSKLRKYDLMQVLRDYQERSSKYLRIENKQKCILSILEQYDEKC